GWTPWGCRSWLVCPWGTGSATSPYPSGGSPGWRLPMGARGASLLADRPSHPTTLPFLGGGGGGGRRDAPGGGGGRGPEAAAGGDGNGRERDGGGGGSGGLPAVIEGGAGGRGPEGGGT